MAQHTRPDQSTSSSRGSGSSQESPLQRRNAKVRALLGRYTEQSGRAGDIARKLYMEAQRISETWAKPYYLLARHHDRILEAARNKGSSGRWSMEHQLRASEISKCYTLALMEVGMSKISFQEC